MDLYEFEGKTLLRSLGITTPRGIFATDPEGARAAGDTLGYPCMIKSQVRTGGRGNAGGIAKVEGPEQAERETARILDLVIRGEIPVGVLVEEWVPQGREIYLSVAFDVSAGSPVLLFSPHGGVSVEASKETLLRIPVDAGELDNATSSWIQAHLESGPGNERGDTLGPRLNREISELLSDLLAAARAHDLELLEINPLLVGDEGLVATDAKVIVDDDAVFRRQNLVLVERPPLGKLEALAKAAALSFVDLDGEICLMANGAGLTMSLLDAVGVFGSSAANFLDTGGGASTAKTHEAMRILQERSLRDDRVRARLIMLSLAITRAREAAAGIIQAVQELPDDPVPTIAVVHGIGAEEAQQMLAEAGIAVAPDVRTAIELAVAAERKR